MSATLLCPPSRTDDCVYFGGEQLLASFMDYDSFFPYHRNNPNCDLAASNMDISLASCGTALAYIFFLPALHIVLRTFVPGIPRGDRHVRTRSAAAGHLLIACCVLLQEWILATRRASRSTATMTCPWRPSKWRKQRQRSPSPWKKTFLPRLSKSGAVLHTAAPRLPARL